MKNNLEDFINEHKEAFDTHEPSEALWSRIENKMGNPRQAKLVSMPVRKLMSAAAAIVIVAAAAFFYNKTKDSNVIMPGITTAKVSPGINDSSLQQEKIGETAGENALVTTPATDTSKTILTPIKTEAPEFASNSQTLESISSEELVHYTRLVELKQAQISILKKDEPLLYKQFATDFSKIDKEYKDLKNQQLSHPSNEQLLEAMIQNLHVQSALLNRQLEIIKTINNSKKKNYEKTYNSSI